MRTTSDNLVVTNAREATHSLEWSSMMLSTSNTTSSPTTTWVTSACQVSFGEVRTEAPERTLGSFLGLRSDEAPVLEHPPDGGARWDDLGVAPLEVIADGLGPGVDAEVQEILS